MWKSESVKKWIEYLLKLHFLFSSKEEVLQLYEELQSSGIPQIMDRFEEVVGNLCREIDEKRDENERLKIQQKAFVKAILFH